MKTIISRIIDNLKESNAGVIGGLVGFVVGILLILFGFIKTLFILFLTAAGYFVGIKLFNDRESIKNFLDKLLPPGRFR